MGEITDTCRPGEAHPSPVRQNAGFEYSLAIVALYPALIPSFHLLSLINNWRYWLPLFPTAVEDPRQIDWYPGLTQHSLSIPRPLTGLRDWHKSSLHISETPETEHGFSPTLKSYQRMSTAHEIFTGQTDTEPKQIRAELQACPDPLHSLHSHQDLMAFLIPSAKKVPCWRSMQRYPRRTKAVGSKSPHQTYRLAGDSAKASHKLCGDRLAIGQQKQWSGSCHFYVSNTGGLIKT